MHWSFNPDPDLKDSYRRRIEDIHRALKALKIKQLPEPVKFIGYFFGCEKLANGIVGIEKGIPAQDAYTHYTKVNLSRLMIVAPKLGVTFPVDELQYIFAGPKDPPVPPPIGTSARLLRNDVAHDFGPTRISDLSKPAATIFNPKMIQFLACSTEVVSYLEKTYVP